MSVDSWKKEFYKKPANKTKKSEAAEHSLAKWRGFKKKNLRKHNVEMDARAAIIRDDYTDFAATSADSCALCHHYFDASAEANTCRDCPLYAILGRNCNAEYIAFLYGDGGRSMRRLLKLAVEREKIAKLSKKRRGKK